MLSQASTTLSNHQSNQWEFEGGSFQVGWSGVECLFRREYWPCGWEWWFRCRVFYFVLNPRGLLFRSAGPNAPSYHFQVPAQCPYVFQFSCELAKRGAGKAGGSLVGALVLVVSSESFPFGKVQVPKSLLGGRERGAVQRRRHPCFWSCRSIVSLFPLLQHPSGSLPFALWSASPRGALHGALSVLSQCPWSSALVTVTDHAPSFAHHNTTAGVTRPWSPTERRCSKTPTTIVRPVPIIFYDSTSCKKT